MNLDYKKFNEKILIMQHLRWAYLWRKSTLRDSSGTLTKLFN